MIDPVGLVVQSPLHILSGGVAVAAVAALLTIAMMRVSVRYGIWDVPNDRSSHARSTPRAGGVAIVLVASASVAFVLIRGGSDAGGWLLPLVGGGLLVGAIGFVDDLLSLRPRTRLIAQVAAATLVASVALPLGSPTFLPGLTIPTWAAASFIVLYVVWLLNLYNFMDGIDGLAGAQAVMVCFGVGWLAFLGGRPEVGLCYAAVGAASAGFLVLNWQPARIFMGDVGSGFLGYSVATLSIWGETEGVPLPTVLILMGVFIVDATFTLLRRLFAGERVYQAHRNHAYQHAHQGGLSHAAVTTWIVGINLCWLFPLAWAAARFPTAGVALVVVAWAPLLAAALWLGAGRDLDRSPAARMRSFSSVARSTGDSRA